MWIDLLPRCLTGVPMYTHTHYSFSIHYVWILNGLHLRFDDKSLRLIRLPLWETLSNREFCSTFGNFWRLWHWSSSYLFIHPQDHLYTWCFGESVQTTWTYRQILDKPTSYKILRLVTWSSWYIKKNPTTKKKNVLLKMVFFMSR